MREQRGTAKAEPERNIENAEGQGRLVGSEAEGGKGQQDIAEAETSRSNQPEASNGTAMEKNEDPFEPSFHPDAASSDARERVWHKVGKSAILIISDTKNKKSAQENEEQEDHLCEDQEPPPASKLKYVPHHQREKSGNSKSNQKSLDTSKNYNKAESRSNPHQMEQSR